MPFVMASMSAECLMNYNSTAMSGRAGRNLISSSLGLLLIDPVMTSELHLDLFRTLGCRRAFFIGENPSLELSDQVYSYIL